MREVSSNVELIVMSLLPFVIVFVSLQLHVLFFSVLKDHRGRDLSQSLKSVVAGTAPVHFIMFLFVFIFICIYLNVFIYTVWYGLINMSSYP